VQAASCSSVQASPLKSHSDMVSFFNLGPYASVRVELQAVTPLGPYRLEVDHPAKKIVEYFDTPFAALVRHAEIESALTGLPK
jgi:hypothetical protein